MAQIPYDLRSQVWDQLYKELFDRPDLRAPTPQEMADGTVVRVTKADGSQTPVKPREFYFFGGRSAGKSHLAEVWKDAWERAKTEDGKDPRFIAWDLGVEHKPVRLPTDDDLAVHRAIALPCADEKRMGAAQYMRSPDAETK